MKKYLVLFYLIFLLPFVASAQLYYPNGLDNVATTTFTFSAADSLTRHMPGGAAAITIDTSSAYAYAIYNVVIDSISVDTIRISADSFKLDTIRVDTIVTDTSSAVLWQIGSTVKPVFSSDSVPVRGMMTDTLHPYGKHTNDYFILKIDAGIPNFIVDLWHRYETDNYHAGGIVEFSIDTGHTWLNVADCPFLVSSSENMYAATSTLSSGDAGFYGNSGGEMLSRLQFINCMGGKELSANCNSYFVTNSLPPVFIRFRFVSDGTKDSLSGWLIDSIRIENPGCIPNDVAAVTPQKALHVYPVPANDGLFHFPAINDAQLYTIEVYNSLGNKIISMPYKQLLDLSAYPKGLYYYRAVNGDNSYSGNLLSD